MIIDNLEELLVRASWEIGFISNSGNCSVTGLARFALEATKQTDSALEKRSKKSRWTQREKGRPHHGKKTRIFKMKRIFPLPSQSRCHATGVGL